MKTSHTVRRGLIVLALLIPPNLFAANRGALHVSSPEEVAGQPLAAGDYVVSWEAGGPTTALTIKRGRQVVATATALVLPLQHASINNSVLVDTNSGKQSLSMIYFSGKSIALKIAGPSEAMNANGK